MKHTKQNHSVPAQPQLFGLIWRPFKFPFRLRAGDVIQYENRLCRVIRVTECAAVVIMNRPARVFKTLFEKPVRIQPAPKIIRICSDSQVPILNRKAR